MPQLGDLQLLGRDQRLVFRCLDPGDCELGGNLQSLRAFHRQRLLQGGNVIRSGVAISIHPTQ
jgi:hypothetical protein